MQKQVYRRGAENAEKSQSRFLAVGERASLHRPFT